MTQSLRRRSARGFTRSEVIVTLALVGIVALFALTYLRTISRRERLLRNMREVQFLLLSARDSAIRRGRQVVVFSDLKDRKIVVWAEEPPYDYVQGPGEPALREYRIPSDLYFRNAPEGEAGDGPSAILFDGYLGNPSLVDRVVFREDGALEPPQSPASHAPRAPRRISHAVPAGSIDCNPGNRCRGIYLSDRSAGGPPLQNVFRLSVDDPGQPRAVTLLKWIPASEGANPGETNYVPAPWKWME